MWLADGDSLMCYIVTMSRLISQAGDSARKPTGGLALFIRVYNFKSEVFFRGYLDAKYFLGCLHILGIFARIQAFSRVDIGL